MNSREAAEANIRNGSQKLAELPRGTADSREVAARSQLAQAFFTAAVAQGLLDIADAIRESHRTTEPK